MVLFAEAGEHACAAVRAARQAGTERVLAVAATAAPLTLEATWRLLDAGAGDVVPWPGDAAADGLVARLRRWREIDALVASPQVRQTLVGRSACWKHVLRQVVEAARYTEASVLILGESGTGKELVARLIHTLDARPDRGRLVVLDCTTVVPELSGSEFFGHEKGAFTNAVALREGAFALADGGTLFLDEVGELPLPLQAELLRVVQERTYKRIGSNTWRQTAFRLICATNRELLDAPDGFRRDLYYRIANWTLRLPPLRERREDILPLARHFLREMNPGADAPALRPEVRDFLLTLDYPGNVRQLRRLVRQMAWRHVGRGPLTLGAVPEAYRPQRRTFSTWQDAGFELALRRAIALGVGLKKIGKATTDTAVRLALADAGGNVRQAARRLGVTDRAIQLRRAGSTAAPTNGQDG
ncbi:MAG: sigma 54-interacting transcriptional regulator [Rhodothermales bacterium]|nr:sigma 54-interacting transcriptional regulator [Rhodothermales bacterium]